MKSESFMMILFNNSPEHRAKTDTEEKKLFSKNFIFVFFAHKTILVAS